MGGGSSNYPDKCKQCGKECTAYSDGLCAEHSPIAKDFKQRHQSTLIILRAVDNILRDRLRKLSTEKLLRMADRAKRWTRV